VLLFVGNVPHLLSFVAPNQKTSEGGGTIGAFQKKRKLFGLGTDFMALHRHRGGIAARDCFHLFALDTSDINGTRIQSSLQRFGFVAMRCLSRGYATTIFGSQHVRHHP